MTSSPSKTQSQSIIELSLCEQERLIMRADVLYLLKVHPGCTRCASLHAAYAHERSLGLIATATAATELLVLAGRGVRTGVVRHYGLFDAKPTLEAAITAARTNLAAGHARAFVAIRIEARVIDGIGDGTERELVRFEVYPDRVAVVPDGQGGLSDEQKAKAQALPKPKEGLL